MTTTLHDIPQAANITRQQLPNGIIVLVYENPAVQSVVIHGHLIAGQQFETPEKGGLASMTASALMHGTHTIDFDALHTRLEDIGADFGYYAGTFNAGFNGRALAEDLPILLDTLNETVRDPSFPPDRLEPLRQQRLTALQTYEHDTRWRASRAFYEHLYAPVHPHHRSALGTPDTLQHLTSDDLRAFHARHYGPAGMVLVIVGAVKADDVVAAVATRLGDWHNPDQPSALALPLTIAPTSEVHMKTFVPGKAQVDLMMGCLGPSRHDPDYRAASLANSILGEFGMMGRIGQAVREQSGLAYYAYSSLQGGRTPSPWAVMAGVDPQNVETALNLIRTEIRRIVSEPVSQQDLADNQSYFIGRMPLRLATNNGIASMIHTIESFDLGLDYLLTYAETINQLTTEDVLSAARHYLDPDRLIISLAGSL